MAKAPIKIKAGRNSGSGNSSLESLLNKGGEVREVDLSKWRRDESQPRPLEEVNEGIEEFADDLERANFELAQYPVFHIEDDGTYTNVVGERRTTAFILKNRKTIFAICKKFTEQERRLIFLLQYLENDPTQSKALSPKADAIWWKTYIDTDHGGKTAAAAKARGRSSADISNRLSFLKLPEIIIGFLYRADIKDPATFAALNRLWKLSEPITTKLMADYEKGEVKGSFRSAVETLAASLKKDKNIESASMALFYYPQ